MTGKQSVQKQRVGLAMTLLPEKESEAARDCLAMMTAGEWLTLTHWAVAVVALAEAVDREMAALVVPAESIPAALQELRLPSE